MKWAFVICAAAIGSLTVDAVAVNDGARRIAITNTALIASPAARERTEYLAPCALDEETEIYGKVGDRTFVFPGGLGLAPA